MPRLTTLCAGIRSIRSPRKRTSPLASPSRAEMLRSVVVLPAPLAPSSVTISPLPTVSEMPRSAVTAP